MEYKRLGNKVILRMDRGEEIVQTLKDLCKDQNINLASIIGLGAVNRLVIGYFDTEAKAFKSHEFSGDFEVTSFHANITTMNGEIYIHPHICVSNTECKTFGGHLSSAVISATGEFIIDIIEGEIGREFNTELGLNLLNFKYFKLMKYI